MRSKRLRRAKLPGILIGLAVGLCVMVQPAAAVSSNTQESGRLTVQVTLLGIESFEVVTEGGHQVLKNEKTGYVSVPGKPQLPVENFMIALPPGAKASSVEVTRAGELAVPGTYRIKPAPMILPLTRDSGQIEKMREEWQNNFDAVYSLDDAYPEFEGKLTGAGTLRKYSYVSVSVCPLSYRPLSGRLHSYNSARIVVDYDLPSEGSAEARKIEEDKRDQIADARAAKLFINYDEMKGLYIPSKALTETMQEPYDYVILTDESLVDYITSSSFYQWKKDTGNNVLILLVSNPSIAQQSGRDLAEQIRNFFRASYLTWGVEHLLIVGDYETVPMRYCFPDPNDHNFDVDDPYTYPGEVPTDYYYADLSLPDDESWDSDGDGYYGEYGDDSPDFLADIYVGRIPTSLPNRVNYALNKIASFEQDTGPWKNQALQPGAILFFENQDYQGYPFCDGARLQDQIETDILGGWTVSRYSEQAGLRTSDYSWPAISESAFITDWRNGQYAVVNWSGHGGPNGVGRSIWQWDDGDGVPESNELSMPFLISVNSNLDDDYPSIVFAVSCLVGYPEPTIYGNLGVDLLTKHFFGAAAAMLSASRPAAVSADWPASPGGAESLCYEFNRFMIDGPDGSEMVGNALYDGKFYSNQNYGWDHVYEYMNMYDYNLYGDPAMLREGVTTPVVDDTDAGFRIMDGSWQTMNYADADGGSFMYNPAGSGDNTAGWRVDNVVSPGKYGVFVWKFDHPYSPLMATDAHYRVRDRDSLSNWILVDQSTPDDEWVYLGSFEFDNNRSQGIMLSDDADGYVIADAVKLVYTGSLP